MASEMTLLPPFDCIVVGGAGHHAARKILPVFGCYLSGLSLNPVRMMPKSQTIMTQSSLRQFTENATYTSQDETDQEKLKKTSVIFSLFAGRCLFRRRLVGVKNTDKAGDCINSGRHLNSLLNFGLVYLIRSYQLVTKTTRIIVKKLIGHDLQSVETLNKALARVFAESQNVWIDYLSKKTLQNWTALRLAKSPYKPDCNSNHSDHIQITVAAAGGLDGRVSYRDQAAGLYAVLHHHMSQHLSFVAMPTYFNKDNAVSDGTFRVQGSLSPLSATNLAINTVRGQYQAGALTEPAPSYFADLQEPRSLTGTFVALEISVENWRWAETPFYSRNGKLLPMRMSEMIVGFKSVLYNIFEKNRGEIFADRLVMRLQPDEGLTQRQMVKDPVLGGMRLRQILHDMAIADTISKRYLDFYQPWLTNAICGNQPLIKIIDEVEAAWHRMDPILEGWKTTKQPINRCIASTWGQSRAVGMIERNGRKWYDSFKEVQQ